MSIRSSICTSTGKVFDFRDPRAESIDVEDVIETLPKLCRFTGHCRGFYSNAAHSIFVADLLIRHFKRPDLELEGLLHETNEAYMNDVNSPLKGELPEYKAMQKQVEYAAADKFALKDDEDARKHVKLADWLAYCIEQRALMPEEAELIDRLSGRAMSPHFSDEVYAQWSPIVIQYALAGNWSDDQSYFSARLKYAIKKRSEALAS